MKQVYQFIINGAPNESNLYLCHEVKAARIEFAVAKQKAMIVAHDDSYTEKEPLNPEKFLNGDYPRYAAALKKVLLFHYIQHATELVIKTIQVTCRAERSGKLIYERELSFDQTNQPLDTVVKGKIEPFPASWKKRPVLEALAKIPLVEKEPVWSMVAAQIMRRGRASEAERFSYNWTTFNTMYAWLLSAARAIDPKCLADSGFDSAGLKLWAMAAKLRYVQEYGGSAKRLRDRVMRLPWNMEHFVEDLKNPASELYQHIDFQIYLKEDNKFKKGKHKVMNMLNVPPYDFFLLRFCYWLRCALFHGNRPLPVVYFANEQNLTSLRAANAVLDDVISEYFPRCVTNNYIESNAIRLVASLQKQAENVKKRSQ